MYTVTLFQQFYAILIFVVNVFEEMKLYLFCSILSFLKALIYLHVFSSKDAFTNYPNNGRAATRDVPVMMTIDIDDVCNISLEFINS